MKRHKGNRWQGVLLGTFLGVSSLFCPTGTDRLSAYTGEFAGTSGI